MTERETGSTVSPDTMIGDRYRIIDLIGRGGMATVYRAVDSTLGRSVALKLFASDGTEASVLQRETSEIRLLASVNHHALVTLFDANVDISSEADRAFLVMELVEGPTLQTRITQGPLDEGDVALMASDLAEALHVVHAQGVVHRDIKPANILLSPALSSEREFRAKLADFGIAYLIDSTRLTTPGTLIGTAQYVSPEQAEGKAPGAASDIYSLGLVLLEALTGVRAFPGTLIESLTARIMRGPDIPGSLGYEWKSLLTAMTAPQPGDRPTALEVTDAARRIGLTSTNVSPSAEDATAALTVAALADADPTLAFPVAGAPTVVSDVNMVDAATVATPTTTPATAAAAPVAMSAPTAATTVTPLAAPAAGFAAGPSAAGAQPFPDRATPSRRTQSASEPAKKSRRTALLVIIVLVLAIAAAVVVWVLLTTGSTAPELPAIDGELGDHLNELMESVTP
ncbi:MAG: serine/threonine-protein kinase [Glaciihabitans sp.]